MKFDLDYIKIVKTADWVGVYLDGELCIQGPDVTLEDFLWKLGLRGPAYVEECDEEWLENRGLLPKSLGDIKWKG